MYSDVNTIVLRRNKESIISSAVFLFECGGASRLFLMNGGIIIDALCSMLDLGADAADEPMDFAANEGG